MPPASRGWQTGPLPTRDPDDANSSAIRARSVALLGLTLIAAGCGTDARPHGAGNPGEDEKVKSLGSIEVTARLVEIPEGAIFQRDLYHYATILKYEVVAVHRGDVETGATIYVGQYDPGSPVRRPLTIR